MNFPKQIMAEMAKMLRSKFILITGILIFAFVAIGIPVISYISEQQEDNYYYYGYQDTVVVGGVEMENNNQLTWELSHLMDMQGYITDMGFTSTELRYAQELIDRLIDMYSEYALIVEDDNDYRMSLVYEMSGYVTTLYVLEQEELDETAMINATNFIGYLLDSVEVLADLSEEEKAERVENYTTLLADFDDLMQNNDFSKYVDIMERSYEQQIEQNLERIETLEQQLIDEPSQEQFISNEIESIEADIVNIEQSYIPELHYREQHSIVPNDGSWQDEALSERTSAQRRIQNSELYKLTEEEFYEDQWQVEQYVTYAAYENSLVEERQKAEREVFVAQSSLDSGEPDMRYVRDGARTGLYGTLNTMMLIAIFAVLVGGWVMATEFQSGTVRLLMIRPRTRLKVLFTRYLAGLKLVYVLYIAIFIVDFFTQGFISGFGDYFYPNYTASGEVNFFVMFLGHFFATSVSFIFAYTLSFALSSVVKNIAVSLIVPTIVIVGSFVGTQILANYRPLDFIAFTPVPYIFIYDLYLPELFGHYSAITSMIEKGIPVSLGLGIGVLLVYSVIFGAIATVVFKKQDITN